MGEGGEGASGGGLSPSGLPLPPPGVAGCPWYSDPCRVRASPGGGGGASGSPLILRLPTPSRTLSAQLSCVGARRALDVEACRQTHSIHDITILIMPRLRLLRASRFASNKTPDGPVRFQHPKARQQQPPQTLDGASPNSSARQQPPTAVATIWWRRRRGRNLLVGRRACVEPRRPSCARQACARQAQRRTPPAVRALLVPPQVVRAPPRVRA